MERPRLRDDRRVEIKQRGALTGDEGTVLGVWGVVTGPGVDCVEREGRTDVGYEARVGRGGCGGTCWAGKVRREVGAARPDRTSPAVTDCNKQNTYIK